MIYDEKCPWFFPKYLRLTSTFLYPLFCKSNLVLFTGKLKFNVALVQIKMLQNNMQEKGLSLPVELSSYPVIQYYLKAESS